MPQTPETPSLQDQLAEIKREAEQNKVELTSEVQEYIRTHLLAVQQKLSAQEPVTEDDLRFMQDVRLWVGMAEEDRNRLVSIEDMNHEISTNEYFKEIFKRKISLTQWIALVFVAYAIGENWEWIDKTFIFSGGGKIKTYGDLDLEGCTSPISIPEGLEVDGDLVLKDCTDLTPLPSGLKVSGSLLLTRCTSLTSFPKDIEIGKDLDLEGCTSITLLPAGLKVGKNLSLSKCTSLTSLPADLKVGGNLWLRDCTSLKSLPADMEVGGNLYLSKYLQKKILKSKLVKDAERLNKEGKIKGEIQFIDL
jgi:hypothetical protein